MVVHQRLTDQWASMDYRNVFDLTGSVAVIGGGSRGIGFEAAVALGSCGATVVLLSRDQNTLNMAVKRLVATGIDATCAVVDVTDATAVTEIADAIAAQHGKVDTLVNSAGIARINSAVDTSDDEWRAVMDVNVNGLFWCCRAFGRHMIARRAGSIINLGSMSGLIVNRPQTAASYMASKGAVHMLTKALAAEWAKSGVRVNALAPGYVATDMTLKNARTSRAVQHVARDDSDGASGRTIRGRLRGRLLGFCGFRLYDWRPFCRSTAAIPPGEELTPVAARLTVLPPLLC